MYRWIGKVNFQNGGTRDWSVVVTGAYLFTGRANRARGAICTGKYEYFILTWLGLHLNAGWYRRLTRPGQQAHRILTNALQRKKKRVSTCYVPFVTIILSETGQKTRWNLTVRNHLFERKILCESWVKEASSRIPSRISDKTETVWELGRIRGEKLLISEKKLEISFRSRKLPRGQWCGLE